MVKPVYDSANESRATLTALITHFLDHGRYLRGWSTKTVRTYEQSLKTLHVADVGGLTKASLNEYILRLQSRGLTPGGINVRLRSLNSFLSWLHEEGHTSERLKVRLLRAPKKVITPLTDSDIRRLMLFKARSKVSSRIQALALLLLDTGLRIEEALALQRARVDLERRCVVVMGKGSRERVVPLSVEGRKALFAWLPRTKGPFAFGTGVSGRMTYRNALRDLTRLCVRVGITTHVHPHALRHTFAANYIRSGGDVYRLSRILGHANISTTALYLRSMGFEALQEGHRSPLSA